MQTNHSKIVILLALGGMCFQPTFARCDNRFQLINNDGTKISQYSPPSDLSKNKWKGLSEIWSSLDDRVIGKGNHAFVRTSLIERRERLPLARGLTGAGPASQPRSPNPQISQSTLLPSGYAKSATEPAITVMPNIGDLSEAADGLFSPNGQILAVPAGPFGQVRITSIKLWDVASQRPLRTIEYYAFFWGVAFTPDGALLATTHADGSIRLWDVQTGVNTITLQQEAIGEAGKGSG
jgi:WD40 repeat protein